MKLERNAIFEIPTVLHEYSPINIFQKMEYIV